MEPADGLTIMPRPMDLQRAAESAVGRGRDERAPSEHAATNGSRSLTYRPELDGIRAIAILLVLAQHINLPSSTLAGLVGVNLFFVLSGYLITSLLVKERATTGRIDIRRFYERRVRRLIPALIGVLIATGVLLAFLGQAQEFPGQAAL